MRTRVPMVHARSDDGRVLSRPAHVVFMVNGWERVKTNPAHHALIRARHFDRAARHSYISTKPFSRIAQHQEALRRTLGSA